MPGHMVGNLLKEFAGQGNGARTALSARVRPDGLETVRVPPKPAVCSDKAFRVPFSVGWFALWLFFLSAFGANAALQFDTFLGYDGVVPEASWFPIICEIKNDGPSFKGTVEITPDYGQGQTRREQVELPTGTLKR